MSRKNGKKAKRTCGDEGGISLRTGEPCLNAAGAGTDHPGSGCCSYHDADGADEQREQAKEVFLVAASDPFRTASEAAVAAGVHFSTIWRWRQQDAAFDSACRKALSLVDRARVRAAEDHLYRRIMEGKATSSEVLFYLSNQSQLYQERKNGADLLTPEDRDAEALGARKKLKDRLSGIRERLELTQDLGKQSSRITAARRNRIDGNEKS